MERALLKQPDIAIGLGLFEAMHILDGGHVSHMLGFVICLPPQTTYGSLNYAWFNQRYDAFLYVDRIAVAEHQRNRGVGSILYEQVIANASKQSVPVAAEVNRLPPNPGSMRFHDRFNFIKVGTLDHGQHKSVTMLLRTED